VNEKLLDFFASHFHQDWADDAADTDAVVDDVIGHTNGEDLAVIANLIDAMVRDIADDRLLNDTLQKLGSYYVPVDGAETRAWLTHVATRLRAASD